MLLGKNILNSARRTQATISQAFVNADIVPQIISKAPGVTLNVTYNKQVRPGTSLKPRNVIEKPSSVRWRSVDYNKLYTLCMTEPDSQFRSDPYNREWLHWLVVNIKGDLIFQGDTIAEYLGVGPLKNRGPQQYVFLVFSQPKLIDVSKEYYLDGKSTRGRQNFSVSSLQIKHDLSDPIAGNYFYAQYDDSVPEFYKMLKEGDRNIFRREQIANEKLLMEIKQKR